MSDVTFTDNSGAVLSALEKATKKALEAIGATAEGHAKLNITKAKAVDTGRLRDSIGHKVDENEVYIGTNVEYAPYIELGTGQFATNGDGRKTPWSYVDEKGNWHTTKGAKPVHFLQKAATEHADEYRNIAEAAFKSEGL